MIRPTLPLTDVYAPIREDLAVVERLFEEEVRSDVPCVDELCAMTRRYRGKMLRPALLLLAARAVDRVRPAHHVLAVVVEMVHLATLVHDDVLDEADERRRGPTVNALAGNVAALLLGDYLFSHAFHLCSSLQDQTASRAIGAAATVVCEGELLQNHHRGNLHLSESEYIGIVRRKTAELTATCCDLGARYAGADAEWVAALRTYGVSCGIAFQIVDDVLDVTGERRAVGKTVGRDAALGKCTLPTIHCLASADAATAARVRRLLTDENGDASSLGEILERTGSIAYGMSVARAYVREALQALEPIPPGEARASLMAMAEFITERRT
jgi:octaprenyl-diphosphate synthase